MKIKYIFLSVIVSAFILCGCGSSSYLTDSGNTEESEAFSTSVIDTEETLEPEIYVQIEGAVKSPGVYRMSPDERVFSVIEKAGGFTKDAYTTDINQAEQLSDGQKIIVETIKEHNSKEASGSDGCKSSDGKVDINKASADELTTINGIGPTRADAIIAYREQNGRFKSIEDIRNVSGIGDTTYSRIKDRIKV